MIGKACRGLVAKIGAYDRRHLEVLLAAVTHVRTAPNGGPELTLRTYDRLTRTFELAPHETFADELRRSASEPDYEKHRYLALTEYELHALKSYLAARHEAPGTLE